MLYLILVLLASKDSTLCRAFEAYISEEGPILRRREQEIYSYNPKKLLLNRSTIYESPARLLIIIIFSVFTAEMFIMFLPSLFPSVSLRIGPFLDAMLLTLIVSPVLFFFGFRPLIIHITERKRAEDITRHAYIELNQIFQTAADGMRLIDRNFNILKVNETFATLTELDKDEAVGKKCYEVFCGPQCHTPDCSLKQIFKGRERIELESIRKNREGKVVPCILCATPFRSPSGEVIGIVEDFKDITRLKTAEEALRKSEEKLNAMLKSIGDHMSMIDRSLNIMWANDIAKEIFGEDIVGKKCYEVYHRREEPCDPCLSLKVFDDGGIHEHDTQVIDKDNRTIYFRSTANVALRDNDGNPTAVIEISRDITESKRLEQQLLQSQKMEAVGQLAGGIAHDFNNILTAIIGYGSLLQMEMSSDDPLSTYITHILNSAQRAAKLTQALLAFSRKQIISPKPVDLNDIIGILEKLLSRLIGEDIELTIALTHKDLTIMADSTQIEQVLMNLATNARDAMPEGGSLIISTDLVRFDCEFITAHGYGRPGSYALISVEDTGQGIDVTAKERIFEPFFTTKEMGKGTGLGLAMVYGIIKQHDGYINVYSEPGNGAIFKIYLPVIKSKVEEMKPEDLPIMAGHMETILVAEDDSQVRQLTREVLENYAYRVLEATDGMDAVKTFRDNKDDIQLVILDVIMPRKNGKECYMEIREIKPAVKAIFTSGYTADIVHKKGTLEEGLEFLSKPVSPQLLLKKVWELLNSRESPECVQSFSEP
jgi:PAS domain S-box-containing protein